MSVKQSKFKIMFYQKKFLNSFGNQFKKERNPSTLYGLMKV